MKRGRTTVLEERVAIAQECIANGKNYRPCAEKHQVSYQQVYSWVKKYEQNGIDGLEDHRGRTRGENPSPITLLREENRQLRRDIEERDREIARLREQLQVQIRS